MYIYTAEDIHDLDKRTEKQGFPLFALMENAGRNIAAALKKYISKQEHIFILSGRGNNGGDGIVVARYLKEAGYQVTLHFPLGTPKTETAKAHLDFYEQQDFTVAEKCYTSEQPDVIVDALLGVGTKPPLRQNAANAVRWANKQSARRYAIDLPTGVAANHGTESTTEEDVGAAVFQADATFVLHGAKPSAFLLPSGHYYGKLISVAIGLKQKSRIKVTTENEVRTTLPNRDEAAHKGTFGTSLLLAGSDDMPGSALLAATGAIRSGTGKLVIGTTRFAASVITPRVPEATYMLDGLQTISKTGHLPPKVSAIGIGPGLEDKSTIDKAFNWLFETDIPLIIDAGALLKNRCWKRNAPTVLTPHPGEFSRLTGISVAEIQADRISAAQDFAQKNDVFLVLKGKHTVIAFPDGQTNINPTGNTGLAKGGSGDVLTGMITSMMSYAQDPVAAVTNAVYLHGLCADIWGETNSEATMTASDFHALLPQVFKRMES